MGKTADTKQSKELIRYTLTGTGAGLARGVLACAPEVRMGVEEGASILESRPNDLFMHRHLLYKTGELDSETLRQLIQTGYKETRPHLLALACEARIINPKFELLTAEFSPTDMEELAGYTPLIYIPWYLERESVRDFYWLKLFSRNMYRHEDLPPPDRAQFPVPFDPPAIDRWEKAIVPIRELFSSFRPSSFSFFQILMNQALPAESLPQGSLLA